MDMAAFVSVVHIPDGAVSVSGSLMESRADMRVVVFVCIVWVVVVPLSARIFALCPV